ncbi:MAG: sigma-70 family RNA polymerase sigma factor [Gemmatimonadota bacterium]|nr:hypothetical protein [Gemmatimonadota bacterium]
MTPAAASEADPPGPPEERDPPHPHAEAPLRSALADRPTGEVDTLVRVGDGEWVPIGVPLAAMIGDLKRAAHFVRIRYGRGETLQTTDYFDEGFARVLGGRRREWNDDPHFRHYLEKAIESAGRDLRDRYSALKRGAGAGSVPLDGVEGDPALWIDSFEAQVLAVVDAHRYLGDLAQADPDAHPVFVLHFAEGVPLAEVAELIGITYRQAKRRWQHAKAYLRMRVAQATDRDADGASVDAGP